MNDCKKERNKKKTTTIQDILNIYNKEAKTETDRKCVWKV